MPDEDINDEAEVNIALTHESNKGNEQKGLANFFVFVDAPNRPVPSPEDVQAKIQRRDKEKAQAKKAATKSKSKSKSKKEVRIADTAAASDDGSGVPTLGPQGGDESIPDSGDLDNIGATADKKANKPARGVGKKTDIPFSRGKLHVECLSFSALASGGKLYAIIELGNSSQTHETTPQKAKDGHLSIDFFDIKLDVERYHIHGGSITVRLFERTMLGGKRLIGGNTIDLDSLLLHVDDSVNLTEHLRNDKHEKKGEMNLRLRLEQLNDVDTRPAIDIGFEHASFEVTAIKLMDLRHTDTISVLRRFLGRL